jgi:hypothetical protein
MAPELVTVKFVVDCAPAWLLSPTATIKHNLQR